MSTRKENRLLTLYIYSGLKKEGYRGESGYDKINGLFVQISQRENTETGREPG